MDRFSNNDIKDNQDAMIYYYCCECGDEIYYGNSFLRVDNGDIVCDKLSCLIGYYKVDREWAGEGD